MLYTPDYVIKELNCMFFQFLWGSKDFVKRRIVLSKLNQGGLNMIDVDSMCVAIKCSWAVRLMNSTDKDIWAIIARHIYKLHADNYLLFRLNFTNDKKVPCLKNIPQFYRQVLVSFNKTKCIDYDDFCHSILEQPL